MKTNADMTLYNKHIDPETRSAKYQRTEIREVAWENRKAANGLRSGALASNTARIFVPFARGANYVKPKAWDLLEDKEGKWTLQDGDVIVKGIVTDEIEGAFTITSLQAKYDDVLAITSVDTMDQGSPNMQHWQLGAK